MLIDVSSFITMTDWCFSFIISLLLTINQLINHQPAVKTIGCSFVVPWLFHSCSAAAPEARQWWVPTSLLLPQCLGHSPRFGVKPGVSLVIGGKPR